MRLETIFSVMNMVAIAGWLSLVVAPLARDKAVSFARIAALVLAASYLTQFFSITEDVQGSSFSTLAGVSALFSKAGNVMLGWTHFLAFDLFVGSWEVEDAGKRNVPHWLVLPCLFFTFMLGPIGLLLYFILRWAWGFWGKEKAYA